MAFVCKVEHGENPILADCERKAKTSLFEQRCIAYHGAKLLRGGIAAYAPGYFRQARAVTSVENDCESVLIRLIDSWPLQFWPLEPSALLRTPAALVARNVARVWSLS
jgi:hypothetical protein